jgi:NodT family efflux transporter outer membrane factor (OMF) lipoprotein
MPSYWKTSRRLPRAIWFLPFALVAVGALGQCGCTSLAEWVHNDFKVGPNYHRPPVPLPHGWLDATDPRVHHGDPNLCTWWDVFDDPILTKLIHDAYANNLTVRAAGFQILQAMQLRCIALGELLPQSQTFILGYTRNMASLNGGALGIPTATFGTGLSPSPGLVPVVAPATPIAGLVDPGTGTTTTTTTSGVSPVTAPSAFGGGGGRFFSNIATSLNASWELDFWGLFRRNLEAADASLDQSVNNYDEMLVLLLANVATKYVEIRTFQRRLQLARQNVAEQEPLVARYQQRYKAGIAASYPGYFQLLSNLENTKALIPVLEIDLRQVNNELCVLLGQPIHDLLPELGDGMVPDPADPSKRIVRIPLPRDYAVVVGIPGEYLLRRPDVEAAEDQLRIQSAQIGIAEAEMYPHMGINGSIGLASQHLSTLFDPRSWAGSIGPSLSWNILNYGRLLANVRAQNDLYQQDVALYQQAILNANEDAENSLVAYLQSISQAEHLGSSADAATKAVSYLMKQLREGYLPSTAAADTGAFVNQIFTAVNFQVTQQDVAAQAEGNIALNLILLYRAMGGGWQIRKEHGHNACDKPAPGEGSASPPAREPASMPPAREPASMPEELPPPRKVPEQPEQPEARNPPAVRAPAGRWYTAADGSRIYLVPATEVSKGAK